MKPHSKVPVFHLGGLCYPIYFARCFAFVYACSQKSRNEAKHDNFTTVFHRWTYEVKKLILRPKEK